MFPTLALGLPDVYQGMNLATPYIKTAYAGPIRPRAFLDALSAVWQRPTSKGSPRYPKLGMLSSVCSPLERDVR